MFETLKWELEACVPKLFNGNSSGLTLDDLMPLGQLDIGEFRFCISRASDFKRLGASEKDAYKCARVIYLAQKMDAELSKDNAHNLETVSGYDTDLIEDAITKWLLIKFLRDEKHMLAKDIELTYKVQEALYNGDQKNDLDDVSRITGIPLDVVRNIDNIMEEFLAKWSVTPQAPAGDGCTQKKKPPKTKPITVGDPNSSQGSPTP